LRIRTIRLDFLQAFRCAFGKLVARFNDLNPGVDHIAGNWFGTWDEDGDQARPDCGKPCQPQTQDARINHRGSRVIGRHYVGTRQRAAIGRHLGEVKPLPVIGAFARAMGGTAEGGYVELKVDVSYQSRPEWLEGDYDSWIAAWD